MKETGCAIPGYKLVNGKLVADEAARLKKMSVNMRIARKKSKRVRVAKPGQMSMI